MRSYRWGGGGVVQRSRPCPCRLAPDDRRRLPQQHDGPARPFHRQSRLGETWSAYARLAPPVRTGTRPARKLAERTQMSEARIASKKSEEEQLRAVWATPPG